MADGDRLIRVLVWGVLNHHNRGRHAEALDRAVELAHMYPHSTPALNLAAFLHTHAATAPWEEWAPGDDEAASASVVRHRRAAVEAYAAAARIAPNCAMTGGMHAEALANVHRFPEVMRRLGRVNPHSTPALNLVASLHTHAATAPWEEWAPEDDEAASASVVRHRRAAVEAYAAAARIAPNCAMTGGMHAEALAKDHRFPEAMMELHRVLSIAETDYDDPTAHHIVYDMIDTSAKARKRDAVDKAVTLMEGLAARINNEIVTIQAANLLLHADAAVGQLQLQDQERAKHISESFPYSSRAQLLRVYIELEQGRAVDEPMRRKAILLRVLDLVSDAADSFDSSLLIALYYAKVLFALDRFDESETVCRRALSIQDPIDPRLDDIPPAVSVPGADCGARVSYLRNQFSVLHTQIVVVAARCWSSILTTQHRERVDRVISVRVDTLQQHYDGIDQAAAKTISHAVRFRKTRSSWSFFVCPNSSCDGKKFVNTESLWEHVGRQHQKNKLWKKLRSVLGPVRDQSASKDDDSLDGITLSQDSEQHDIFNLPNVKDMFESLFRSPIIGIQAEPLVEMRRRKCREGAEILEDIKKKLRMLPKDKLSTEFEEVCSAIKNMWLKLLETAALDHREVILPLARSFQWIQMKRSIALSAKDLGGIIGAANIDAVFDLSSDDNLQPEKLKPSAEETLKAAETCEESEVSILQRVSSDGGMRVILPVQRMMQLIWYWLQTVQSFSQDGAIAFDLGVRVSNASVNMLLLQNKVNEALEYMNQAKDFLETFGLGDGPGPALQLIGYITSIAQMTSTANTVLIINSRALSFVGMRLQERHPNSQNGDMARRIRSVVNVSSVEEAEAVITEWEQSQELVEVEVNEDMSTEEAHKIYNMFVKRSAYDLITDSSVLLSKVQSSDEPGWVIV